MGLRTPLNSSFQNITLTDTLRLKLQIRLKSCLACNYQWWMKQSPFGIDLVWAFSFLLFNIIVSKNTCNIFQL